MRNLWLVLLAVAGISIGSCNKDKSDDPSPVANPGSAQEMDKYLQEEAARQDIPAMAVLVFKEGNIAYERYLGVRDKQTNEPLEATDVFLLASVSKTVTATALMQLYEQGKFKLDDAVNDYLPFTVRVPGYSKAITFRMLLTHTSAIADGKALDGQYYDDKDSPVPLASFLQDYLVPGGQYYDAKDNFYDFEPGTEYEYSNTGCALIAVLVEVLSGTDFNTYCRQHIFAPMGMQHTYWKLGEVPQAQLVSPYDGGSRIAHYTFTDYPNGGLRSTVQDMRRLLAAYCNGGMHGNTRLLKAETVTNMWTVQNAAVSDETGLHWFIMNKTHNLWGHDGGEKGVATIIAANAERKTGVLIFTNQGDAVLDNMLTTVYNYATGL